MAFKLLEMASKRWRRFRAASLAAKVIQRVVFVDGIEKTEERKNAA